ncbi:nose resistant to fluoxetine protein 6-like [Pararge aegeria]|uniref:nose resistant to fluoxetine protein 6-like n=1 Tax=Pararge aegeria TaxID=116150 RepID=UPI0019D0887C|nr:nose resistant to fluoxetine protein 6-like [Pararge aegeria]
MVNCSTIVTFIVVYGHTVLLIATFTSNPHSFEKAYESVALRITFSGLNVVQVFFFITGMLLTHSKQISAETHKVSWKMIPKTIFNRWWRLTPSAVMMVAFSATWMRHLGSGPLWKTVITGGTSGQCRRFFWAHLFYFNNYIPEDTLCSLQTWYIATDMQIYIVGVITHFAIRNRSGCIKEITLTSLLLLSMASPALHVWWQDIEAFAMQTPELYRTISDVNFRNEHVLGHNNLSAFIIGLATGYLIYYLQQKKVEYPNFKIGRFLSWFTIPTYLFLLYCGSLFYHDGKRPSLALRVLYAATNRAIIGLIATYVIVAVTLKFNGFTKALLEQPSWVVPSKLTYCVYLLHMLVLDYGLGVKTQLTPVSFFNTFFMTIGVFVASFVIAVPFHLLIEAPTNRLMKLSSNAKTVKKLD